MSHFTLLVIGDDHDALLAPYDENLECAPTWEPAAWETLSGAESWADKAAALNDEDEPCRVNAAGDGVEYRTTRNPLAKWDWYAVGGRWPDRLHLLNGRRCSQAVRRDIDIEGMRKHGAAEGLTKWHRLERLLAGLPDVVPFDDIDEADIEAKRKVFWDQPSMMVLRGERDFDWDCFEHWEFWKRGERLAAMEGSMKAVPGFATLTENGWMEPGRMGWFGASTDDWNSRVGYWEAVNGVIDAAPVDAVFTMVDCHI